MAGSTSKKKYDIDSSENLDELTEKMLKDETPTGEAVNALIKVRDHKRGEKSDIELKTDLSASEVKLHAVCTMLNNVLEMSPSAFSSECILGELINSKERKALSKDRKSRMEIVEVARQPDMQSIQTGDITGNRGLLRRLFTPRQRRI